MKRVHADLACQILYWVEFWVSIRIISLGIPVTEPKKNMSWKVVGKRKMAVDKAVEILSATVLRGLGDPTYRYTVEHEDTGERKDVLADDRYELGDKISSGDFQ